MSTLKDVAALAGVSPATASLALNGKAVNETTRKLVLDCAKRLNYFPNRVGQTLITGQSRRILMVILNSTRHSNILRNTTFFYYFIEGVLEVAGRHGYSVTFDVRDWEDPELGVYFAQNAHGKSIDGMIVIPQYQREYTFLDSLGDLPRVLLNPCDDRLTPENALRVDNRLGGEIVARFLIGQNAASIGFINGPEDHFDATERRRGFMEVVKARGSGVKNVVSATGDWTVESGYRAAESIFRQEKVDAVFCGNDFMAAGVYHYLYERGLSVPEDVSLIGYDNSVISDAVFPRLTTVDGRLFEIGSRLCLLLLARMGAVDAAEPMVLEPFLVERDSTRKGKRRPAARAAKKKI